MNLMNYPKIRINTSVCHLVYLLHILLLWLFAIYYAEKFKQRNDFQSAANVFLASTVYYYLHVIFLHKKYIDLQKKLIKYSYKT